jgi:GH24 family phage-related lysozyme (muramidase)
MTVTGTTRTPTIRAIAALTLLLVGGVASTAVAQSRSNESTATSASTTATALTASSHVPPALVPPAGQSLIAQYKGEGVQIYQCTAGAWVFVEPAANLKGKVVGVHGSQTAVHFRGPSWESTNDGSLVEAKAIANSPVTGSIPQLLLQASVNRGTGVFGSVTYIQRLNTKGGAAPSTSCTAGQTTGIPYEADYNFFAPSAA